LAILGQKSLDRFGNTIPVQKLKLLPLTVSEGYWKQSNISQPVLQTKRKENIKLNGKKKKKKAWIGPSQV